MSRTTDFIRGLLFVVAFSTVTTYWVTTPDLTTNIFKTVVVFSFCTVLTWILVRMVRREGRGE